MFDHKHYVPIIKTKAGERWAVGHLKAATRSHITPLFECHEHKDKVLTTHMPDLCEDVASVWDDDFFLDTKWLHDTYGVATSVTETFNCARTVGLSAIPVATPQDAITHPQVYRAVVDQDKRGLMLRVPSGAITQITPAVNSLSLPPSDIHLLIDYQTGAIGITQDIASIPQVAAWRTFSVASAAFPRSLGGMQQQTWNLVSRSAWLAWEQAVTGGTLTRKPAFSDYVTRDPSRPADFGEPPVNLRYTTTQNWMVNVHGKFKDGDAPNMNAICTNLVARQEFCGPTFSSGDLEINNRTIPNASSGNPTSWLQWGMNHHIEFVVHQITTHAGL